MTQEEKQLLLKDLCARSPYGTYVHHKNCPDAKFKVIAVFVDGRIGVTENEFPLTPTSINECKPYLRPMSSMTEEEREELEHLSEEYFGKAMDKQIEESLSSSNRNESEILEYIASSVIVDWLNSHHLDYRGLIEKGLALESPEGMYKI